MKALKIEPFPIHTRGVPNLPNHIVAFDYKELSPLAKANAMFLLETTPVDSKKDEYYFRGSGQPIGRKADY